jgi:hypothetical protein
MAVLRGASSEEVFTTSLRLQLEHRSIDCLLGTALIELGVNPAAFFEKVDVHQAPHDPVVLNGLPIATLCAVLGVKRSCVAEALWLQCAQEMQDNKVQWGEIAKTIDQAGD